MFDPKVMNKHKEMKGKVDEMIGHRKWIEEHCVCAQDLDKIQQK